MVQALTADDPREISGYVLRGRLGAGGMGVVYLSYTRGGQPVALKVVRREYAEDAEFRRRFAREVEAARRVQGAYTTPVLDSDAEGGQPWLASAYVPGPALADAVRTHGPLPPGTVLSLVAGIAEALQSIHAEGVVHRDLKPTNVLLASDGPRVIDFGIARATDATALTGTDVRLGTPAYMSPEQVTGSVAGPEIDVFALGMVAYFAATGGHPFGEGQGHAILYRIVSLEPELGDCPPQLRELVTACLAKDPARRPSPAEVIELCRRGGDGADFERGQGWWLPEGVAAEVTRVESDVPTPVPHAPTQRDSPASPPARAGRSPALVIAGAVLAALVVGGGAAYLVNQLSGEDSPSDSDSGTNGSRGDASWRLTKKDERVVVRAPSGDPDPFSDCSGAPSTFVDLDKLSVVTGSNHGNYKGYDMSMEYLYCGEDGTVGDSGIKLLDGEGVMGSVDRRDVSAAECRTAAREADVGNPVTVPQIQKDSVLRAGMGLCVETKEKNVVLLWIDRVDKHPQNNDLRTYVTTASLWKPK